MEDLYRRHDRLMYFIAGKYTANAQKREDIVYLEKLPTFNADGTVKG